MRARRRRVNRFCNIILVAVGGEDGLKFGPDQPIILCIFVFIATLEFFALVTGQTRGQSRGGLSAGAEADGGLGGRLQESHSHLVW